MLSEDHIHSNNADDQPEMGRRFWLICRYLCISLAIIFLLLCISVLSLRWVNPSFTAFTLLENWQSIEAERYNLRDWWVSGDQIPEHLKWAVIASEDQLFMDHRGFDTESIRKVMEQRGDGGRVRGASTISQQVVKNLYLWPAQSYIRKGIEAGITILIELFLPKERILEIYLNIAEFGPGVFGAGKAAHDYFGLSAEQLNPRMSAQLAVVLPSPKRMQVASPGPYATERIEWVLTQMTQLTGNRYRPMAEPDSTRSDTLTPFPDELYPIDYDEDYFPDFETDSTRIPAEPDSVLHPVEPDTVDSN
ncbi:MAG: monofunctional biosynthetic peptidoglycan transglycosylase [Balneolaceae bacterium]